MIPAEGLRQSEGDFLGIISLGCVMENMWLEAKSLGIGFHVVSALSAPDNAEEVSHILRIPERLRIAFSCRIGYPAAARNKYLRVRRKVEDFAHKNRYGSSFECVIAVGVLPGGTPCGMQARAIENPISALSSRRSGALLGSNARRRLPLIRRHLALWHAEHVANDKYQPHVRLGRIYRAWRQCQRDFSSGTA